jgi:LCP family protein required for cell wall assembly
VIRWVAIVVVLVLLAAVAYAVYNYHSFTSNITHVDAIPSSSTTTSKLAGQNILLVGDDHRPADASAQELAELGTTQDGGGTNTDTMMVLHIPSNGAKASLISFPRDSWVDIPGYGMGKLNAAFAYGSQKGGDAGGAQLLVQTVENLSGLHIDHFVRISLLGFYDVAKALPEIKVCLVNAVDDPYSTFKAPAGVSTLNAMQALAFVRQRHGLPQGDLDREIRQRYFLTAEAKNFASASTLLNPGRLNAALKAMSGAIQTDPGLNFLSLASQLKDLAGGNLTSTTIPISGTPTIYYNGSAVSIVKVDTAAMPAFVAKLDEKTTASASASAAAPAPQVAPSSVTVTVLNGGGVSGAAATSTASLEKAGFRVTTPSTVSSRTATTIQYPASMASAAALVARYVPGATLEAVTGVSNVTVVLGTDGSKAQSTPSAASSGSSGSSSSGSSSSGSSSGTSAAATPAASSIPCIN